MHTRITHTLGAVAAAGALTTLGLAGTSMPSAAASTTPAARPAHPVTAYVANFSSGTVTPISTAINKAGKPITVGGNPAAIAITPDGKTAYVALDNSTSRGDFPGQVIPISTVTNKAGKGITVGIDPAAIAITP
jgi:YVTN family beta-propeller protein